jgi:hypothetical protein
MEKALVDCYRCGIPLIITNTTQFMMTTRTTLTLTETFIPYLPDCWHSSSENKDGAELKWDVYLYAEPGR